MAQRLAQLIAQIAGTQVKAAPGRIAERHQLPGAEFLPSDHGVMQPGRGQPLREIPGQQEVPIGVPAVGLGAGIDHDRIELRGVRRQLHRQPQGLLHGLPRLSGKTHDEAPMDQDAEFPSCGHKGSGLLQSDPLPDVVEQDLGPAFETDTETAATGPPHHNQGLPVDIDPGVGSPGQLDPPAQHLLADGKATVPGGREGVVLKKDGPDLGKGPGYVFQFVHHPCHRMQAQTMAHHGLRIDAKNAAVRTAPAGGDGHHGKEGIGVKIVLGSQKTPVYRAHHGQDVKIGEQLPRGGAPRFLPLPETEPGDGAYRPAARQDIGDLANRLLVLANDHSVHLPTEAQRVLGQGGDMGPDQQDHGLGDHRLERFAEGDITGNAGGAGIDDQQTGGEVADPGKDRLPRQPRRRGVDEIGLMAVQFSVACRAGQPERIIDGAALGHRGAAL